MPIFVMENVNEDWQVNATEVTGHQVLHAF